MGFDKLTADVLGKPVLRRTAEAFASHPSVEGLTVVAHINNIEHYSELLGGVIEIDAIIPGGTERCHSVWNGLVTVSKFRPSLVAIHDAARPLISHASISSCLEQAVEYGAATCASRVTSTLKRETNDHCVGDHVERDGLWSMETPQIFKFSKLHELYAKALESGLLPTDETSVMAWAGEKVKLVETRGVNCKVTVPGDLELVRALVAVAASE